ncbi:MAG: DegT/DnrJ/EryC1/StrS family aminotransferase [Ruminococcaceae bacterium]|nr:DegT/DnrJ/EryC1/StrS family aminotransferase [Oscillospiraceae bacterium]
MAEKLALFGGEKVVGDVQCQLPLVAPETYDVVKELMQKDEISTSPIVNKFEKKFADYIGVDYGLCCVNGTTSIQAGLFAVGVGAGDEVIVPSFTFWATVGPVAAANAIPVFADVDEDTHTLTAADIEKHITPRTKAILVVHVWGNPCDMDPIMELAKKHNLKVVEDCSHAHGATYHGKKVGSIGDVGCFSMQGSKVLAAGEGGILVTNNREYFERACALGHYERLGGFPDGSEYKKFALTGFGYKHRIHPLAVAIADGNLNRLDELNKNRTKGALYLEELISDLDFIKPLKTFDDSERVFAYHYAQYIPEKLKGLSVITFLKALAAEGVYCGSCGYGKLHQSPFYNGEGPFGKGCPFACPHYAEKYVPTQVLEVTEKLAKNSVMIAPRFEIDNKEVVEQYAKAYHKVYENIDELLKYEEENNLAEKKIVNDGRSINVFR